jgi:hypothetical protein
MFRFDDILIIGVIMPIDQRLCPKCGNPTKLMLPPSGDGPRAFLCLDCDFGDPMKRPNVQGWLHGELAHTAEKFPKK